MKYISITTWRDLTDRHLYHEGDPFPFDGREIPKERLTALTSGQNLAGLALVRAEEANGEPEEGTQEEAPEGATEAKETASAEEPEPMAKAAQGKTTGARKRGAKK